jgi:Ornithine cyclodeaminase/mu-crystallin family
MISFSCRARARLSVLTRLRACPNARGTGNLEKRIMVNWLTPSGCRSSDNVKKLDLLLFGADDETKCELDAHCLKRANRLIVDSRDSARDHGEVHRWLKQGVLRMEDIHGELGEVLAGTVPGRRSSKEITIAKFVGIGVQDLAAAEVSIDKLKQAGQGLLSTIPTVR